MVQGFQLRRYKLPPEAFVIGPAKEPEPTDPIDADTWGHLTTLPDDVAIRTSEHHGTMLRNASEIQHQWVCLCLDLQSLAEDPPNDPLQLGALYASDKLQVSIYMALTGFYRQAVGALRGAVESVVTGAYFRAFPEPARFTAWLEGQHSGKVRMVRMRQQLAKAEPYAKHSTLFSDGGWVAEQYGRLSAFSHGRPFHRTVNGDQVATANVEIWQSNGPVYVTRAVRLWAANYLDAALLGILLVGLAEPRLRSFAEPQGMPLLDVATRVLALEQYPAPTAVQILTALRAP